MTVAQHGGAKVEVAQVGERITVAHHQARHVALLVDVHQAELHKLVSRLHFLELRALFARTGQNTIAHEVALVRAGIVIARVQAADALFQFFGIVDALVDPVPDGTAHARIARLDGVPILAEVTDGVTHGVRILTNKDRFVHVVAVFLHPRNVGIHLRIEIREAFAAEGAMNARSFVVHGAGGIHLLRQIVASTEVFAVTALVTQTPHHDRGVVVITRHHFANAIFESRNPALQIRNRLVGVVFQVGLIAGIKAEMIEHGIHARIVRIVRGANQVHIVLLHQQDVAQHRLVRHGTTALGIGVLAVHALEEYALPVDVHQGVDQFDFAETIFRAPRHFLTAGRIVLTEAEGVEMGRFGRPVGHVLQVKFHLLARQVHVLAGRRLELPALRSHFLAVGTIDVERHGFGFCLFRRVAQSEVDRHRGIAIVVAQHISDAMIVDRGRGQTVKVDIAEDTAHAEHILAFEIRTVAPAHHLHRKAVFAGAQIGGKIVFTHIVRALTIAHFVAVEPNRGRRIDATEMNDRAATVPRSRQREGAHIRAHGVDAVVRPTVVVAGTRHDVRRRVGVRILHIAVDGVIITEHLPVGRHRNVVPAAHIETVLEEIGRTLRGFTHEVELPRAVEREIAFAHGHRPRRGVVCLVGHHLTFRGIGLESRVPRQAIDGKHRFVFPSGRLNFGFVHFVERHPSRAIFHIEGHNFHLVAAQGEHLALLVVGSDHICVRFAGHRHDGQLRIAGAVHLRRPLQEIVDRGIVAAVVKVLGEIGIAHHTTREVEHLDVPILSAVHRIFAFGHDACAVFGQFAVAEHEAGTIHEAQAISLCFIEARNIGQRGTEHRMFVTACGG